MKAVLIDRTLKIGGSIAILGGAWIAWRGHRVGLALVAGGLAGWLFSAFGPIREAVAAQKQYDSNVARIAALQGLVQELEHRIS